MFQNVVCAKDISTFKVRVDGFILDLEVTSGEVVIGNYWYRYLLGF